MSSRSRGQTCSPGLRGPRACPYSLPSTQCTRSSGAGLRSHTRQVRRHRGASSAPVVSPGRADRGGPVRRGVAPRVPRSRPGTPPRRTPGSDAPNGRSRGETTASRPARWPAGRIATRRSERVAQLYQPCSGTGPQANATTPDRQDSPACPRRADRGGRGSPGPLGDDLRADLPPLHPVRGRRGGRDDGGGDEPVSVSTQLAPEPAGYAVPSPVRRSHGRRLPGCPRWESNPHSDPFKGPASTVWATGAQPFARVAGVSAG